MIYRLSVAFGMMASVLDDVYRDIKIGFIDGFVAQAISEEMAEEEAHQALLDELDEDDA